MVFLVFTFCTVFFFPALILRDFDFMYFSSIFGLISRIEGVVRTRWMTSLLYLFRIVWRQGAGHSRRTQDGDGSLGSKVLGWLLIAGRTCLFYSDHKLLPLPGGCFVLWFACNSYLPFVLPLVLCPTPFFTSSGVFLFSSFFSSSFFSSVCHGGRQDSLFLLVSIFNFFPSFDLSSLFSFSSLIVFFRFSIS